MVRRIWEHVAIDQVYPDGILLLALSLLLVQMTVLLPLQLEDLFSSSFSLQAEDAAGHFGKAPAAALQGPEQATALPSSSQAPFDWSLKTRVRFVSSEPFAEEAVCSSSSAGLSALQTLHHLQNMLTHGHSVGHSRGVESVLTCLLCKPGHVSC